MSASSSPAEPPEGRPRRTGAAEARVPIWARTADERRSGLSREAIVAAAIEIADAEGLSAVSIRRVAAALGARTMSLYTYIARKEDLLDLMADEVAAEVLIRAELPADWREAISMIARRERAVAMRHPWVVDLLSQRPQVGPNGLRHAEQSLAALHGLGVDPRTAWRIVAAVDVYMTGTVIRQVLEREAPRRAGVTESEQEELMQPYFQRLIDSGEFPNLAPILAEGVPDEDFERGLAWLLAGIAAEYGG